MARLEYIENLSNDGVYSTGGLYRTTAPTVSETIAAGPSPMAVPLPTTTVGASNPALNNHVAAVNQVLGEVAEWDDDDPDTHGFYYDDENIFETAGIVNSDPNYFRNGKRYLLDRKKRIEIERILRANGIIDGAVFGLPGIKFKKLDTYDGPSHIEYYDEVFPDEIESFLGFGKKAKAKREERKAKRVARRDARKDARAARKQARVDRKNKRVEIRAYKAETKRIKAENGEPSALDNILDTVANTFGPQQDLPLDGELNPADYSNGDLAQGYKPFTLDADASGRAIQAGGNKSLVYILIGLAVLGAAIYFVTKDKN